MVAAAAVPGARASGQALFGVLGQGVQGVLRPVRSAPAGAMEVRAREEFSPLVNEIHGGLCA
jgi:hypothetical protein